MPADVTFTSVHTATVHARDDCRAPTVGDALRHAGFTPAPDRDHGYRLPDDLPPDRLAQALRDAIAALVGRGHPVTYLTVSPSPLPAPALPGPHPDVDRLLGWADAVARRLTEPWLCAVHFGHSDDDRTDLARRLWTADAALTPEHIPAHTAAFHHLATDLATLALPSTNADLGFTLVATTPSEVIADAPFTAACAPAVHRAPADPDTAAWTLADLHHPHQRHALTAWHHAAARYAAAHRAAPIDIRLDPGRGLIVETRDDTPDWIRDALSRQHWEPAAFHRFHLPGTDQIRDAVTALRAAGVPVPDPQTAIPDTSTRPRQRTTARTDPPPATRSPAPRAR